eukprot:TRINITY_DN22186_c0_g1_i2.p1 TRINITY_DN22186_c0_g1~~TRINITY_DN22186_c0_g1_i2.p1  ORF type:complete len:149 (-),score=61.27 TRINITY_DN22186_c0_g1_i2:113-559(-)
MIRRPPRSTQSRSSAASDVYKRQAEEHKGEGNEHYKAKRFSEAIDAYSRAIAADPANPTYYSNRSAAWQASGKMGACLEDCVSAVRVDPTFIKCLQRGVKVATSLGKLELAGELAAKHAAIDPEQEGVVHNISPVSYTHLTLPTIYSV